MGNGISLEILTVESHSFVNFIAVQMAVYVKILRRFRI